MTCEEYKLTIFSESGATPDASAHAAGCATCRAFAEGVARDARLLRAMPSPALPARMWDRLDRRIAPPRPVRRLVPFRYAAAASVAALIFAAVLWSVRPPSPPAMQRRRVKVIEARDPRVEQGYARDFASQGGPEMLAVVATEEEGN